ncbi:MAG: S1 RNA-binding domain-containing protein, partial [Pirellulales bacterium]
MVNRNLIRGLELDDEILDREIEMAMGGESTEEHYWGGEDLAVNSLVDGKILRVDDEFVLVDVGYKSEGLIPRNEWDEHEPPEPGQKIRVLIEDVEDALGLGEETRGMINLSKRKARKIEDWENVMKSVHENDVVTGNVTRKIKGGLLVDISGVNVFLPASQVDIRRPADIGDYVGREIKCIVLKIDEARRNIVVSRRALIEQERALKKKELLETLEVGQLRKGVVKNIADFGAFVDLG